MHSSRRQVFRFLLGLAGWLTVAGCGSRPDRQTLPDMDPATLQQRASEQVQSWLSGRDVVQQL